jgi:hypothetical protein
MRTYQDMKMIVVDSVDWIELRMSGDSPAAARQYGKLQGYLDCMYDNNGLTDEQYAELSGMVDKSR